MRNKILLLVFILLQSWSFAQIDPIHNIKINKPISSWLVAGPFPNPLSDDMEQDGSLMRGFNEDFLIKIGGEKEAIFEVGKIIPFTDFDNTLQEVEVFKSVTNDRGILSFDALFPDLDYKAAYIYAELFSDKDQNCFFMLGSDDGVKVWLNGKLIHSNDIGRGLIPREDKFNGDLIKGKNRILVKVTDFVRNWEVIVEPFDSSGYENLIAEEKEKNEFYKFLNAELSVPIDWESGITFYAGDKFPDLVWNKPSLVEKVAGKLNLNIRWFNSDLEEVIAPNDPGMYAYYAEGTSERGYNIKRSGTLYAFPSDWYGWSEAPKAYLEYQPLSTIDSSTWENNKFAIAKYVGRMFNRSSLTQGEASILYSFLDHQNAKSAESMLNTPIIFNGDYHVALKRKVLGVENKWDLLKKPQVIEEKTKTLSNGSELEAGVKEGTKEEIRKLCSEWFDESLEPFDILIARNGVVIINESFGEDGYGKFTTETPTEIASITKMLTGLLFAQFVDQGLINIDSYVGDFLPDFETNNDTSLTLRNCFTHTSGLFGHGAWGGVQNPWMDNSIANLIPTLPVNKVHQYNGVGYNLAGKVMEIVTGKSVFRLLRENVFDPLVMKNTYNEKDLAYGTHSTAYDLALVGQMVLNG